MSKRHKAVIDAVLDGLPEQGLETKAQAPERADKSGARFLKRSSALADRARGDREEKTLRWVEPAECRMWGRHNRAYNLLNEANCNDLIDGIRAQGRQEFPAIVRATDHPTQPYEVICGARRHFAITWLQQNNYPQFKYLIEIRDLTDEEAFRLADIENRERQDISDFERARDYLKAIDLYYGGKQASMAERLEVSNAWLSRYLQLARLPKAIVDAFYEITDLKESHARVLKPLLARPSNRDALLARAAEIEERQIAARGGQGRPLDATQVMVELKAAIAKPRAKKAETLYRGHIDAQPISVKRAGRKISVEFAGSIERSDLDSAWEAFLKDQFPQ